jgi:hypothetical protein
MVSTDIAGQALTRGIAVGPWLVALVGSLIVAAGLGVVVQTKWASNVSPNDKKTRYQLSWPVVGVGLAVIIAGVVMSVAQSHPGGTNTNNNTNIVYVTGGNSCSGCLPGWQCLSSS